VAAQASNVRSGFAAPKRFEADVEDCDVVGEIPTEIHGAFVRVGGEWFYPPKFADDAPLHADGYVSSFRFHKGKVRYKGRWIRTARFLSNLERGRQRFGYYRNRFTDDDDVRHLDGSVLNTAPIAHARKLFALKEDTLAHELDPNTLALKGSCDFDGAYKSQTFTAHPKIDAATGEMFAFGYEATGPASNDLFLYVIDRHGSVTREVRIKLPYVSMAHDMALTERHILFPFGGYVTSMTRLREGKVHWGWDRTLPSYIGMLPRDGEAKDIRWFRGPERGMLHTFNARSESNRVILEAPFMDSNLFPFFPAVDGSAWDPHKARARIRRVTFDLNSNDDRWQEEILFSFPVVDLARIDTRYMGHPSRFGFAGFHDPARPFQGTHGGIVPGPPTNSYGRFDFSTGTFTSYFAGPTCALQECCFVPRRPGAPEGDGYLIGTASNFAEMRTELIIADAQRLDEGDVARVVLPFRSDAQIHGIWVDASELPFVV
jgi:carotenoid cleavage dioxygenase-like enzyme